MRAAWACALLAACSGPATVPAHPGGGPAPAHADAPPVDAAPPSQEETLAAIQLAMNALDDAAQGCWAVAATARFDIEGDVVTQIEIAADHAVATTVSDTTRNPTLLACLTTLLGGYPWAPPLHGQTIRLPFRFRSPGGQNVIDRTLVPWNGQGALSIAVLLDDANTGNDAASMLEVALDAGGTTGLRVAERTELWFFLGTATVHGQGGAAPAEVRAGDMVYVPKGGARKVTAGGVATHAVMVLVPGGREGTARAGALPTPEVGATLSARVGPQPLYAKAAKTFGPATIFAEPATIKTTALAASVLTLPAGATVADHVHADETELLYILEGAGTLTIAGVEVAVRPTSVVQVPPNTRHAFVATTALRALQLYTPAGPEQRFKNPTRKATP